MSQIDETIDLAITLLERGATGDTEQLATWIVDNLVHVLEEWRSGSISRCDVSDYSVLRVAERVAVTTPKVQLMNAEQARMLAAALLRAAEAADEDTDVQSEMP